MSQQMPERIPGGGVDLSHLAANSQQGAGAPAPGQAPGQAPVPGAGQPPQVVDVPSLVLDVTDTTFEQTAQLSAVVPVVLNLWSPRVDASAELNRTLEKVVRGLEGRALLAKVDADANPGLAQALQAQSLPSTVALVGGRPVPLFQGAVPEEQVAEVFTQLLQLAGQQGVTGRVNALDADQEAESAEEPEAPQIPEAHVPAMEAAERGDYATAVEEWEKVLAKAPADAAARASLVQVKLLGRLDGHTTDGIRSAAAAAPTDLEAQMRVADLDVSGGHVEDAFLRLLDLFSASSDDAERTAIRTRLLELFEVVGVSDPRVSAARTQLANLLY